MDILQILRTGLYRCVVDQRADEPEEEKDVRNEHNYEVAKTSEQIALSHVHLLGKTDAHSLQHASQEDEN